MAGKHVHVVRPGEYLAQIAARHGLDPDEIWDHHKNSELRERRRNPNILCPGDLLFLPEKRSTAVSVAACTSNAYEASIPATVINVMLFGPEGPARNVPILVGGLDERPRALVTDDRGNLEIADVPVTTHLLTLESQDGKMRRELRIGQIDPISEATGVSARLGNLGFLSLESFQQAHGLNITGIADHDTLMALARAYGC